MRLGADDSREGALCRLADAQRLLEKHRGVAAAYLAGRAVESMLRALLWLKTPEQTIGHDLPDLLKRVRWLGLLKDRNDDALIDAVQDVASVWDNNLRFAGDAAFLRHLKRLRRDRAYKTDPVKGNARHLLDVCETIVARGEIVWQRSRRK